MINMIQILFVGLILVVAFTNAIGILKDLLQWIVHPAPRIQRSDNLSLHDPAEMARRSIMGDPNYTLWDLDSSDTSDFSSF